MALIHLEVVSRSGWRRTLLPAATRAINLRLDKEIDWFFKNGQVNEKPKDVGEIIDHQFVDYAISVLGKYK